MIDIPPIPSDVAARARETFARVPFVRLLGMTLEHVAMGAASVSADARPDLAQTEGLLHGGVTFSVMDTAAAFAVFPLLEPGETTVTVDFSIHYLRPIFEGRVTARAAVVRAGRRLISLSVEATDQAGVLVATALTTYARRR